jgi:hypothetical protein
MRYLRCESCEADLSNIKSMFVDEAETCPFCGGELVQQGEKELTCMDTLDELARRLNDWRIRALRAEAKAVFMDVRLCEIQDLAAQRWRGE